MKFISPITLFIFASAGVHTALVLNSNMSTAITLPGEAGSVMNVKVQKEKKNLPKQVTQENLATKTPPQHQAEKIKSNPEKSAKSTQKKAGNRVSVASTKSQQTESKAKIISVIYKELNQHFAYPRLAQKRNWQGKVLLSLRVSTSGKINNVQIYKSSGYSILDQAAIDSLIKVGYLPQISSWLPYDINLTLPVIYQLTEG